jgi:hypothetical protein
MSNLTRIPWLLAAVGLLATALIAVSASSALAKPQSPTGISPANFVRHVDNEYFPLRPGTTYYYAGEKDGIPTTNEVFVTHETKVIMGVTTTVVHDNAYEDGVLNEKTIDWYAQDKQGNVWYFGEDAKELAPDGTVVSTEGSWQAGVSGAQPGIVMKGEPRVGDRYNQEVAPGVAEDKAQVLRVDASKCAPYGCFDEVLVTKEWTPLHPGIVERKWYAEGIGMIAGKMVKGGSEHTELVKITNE